MSTSTTDQVLRYKGFTVALSAAAGGLVLGATLGLTGVLDLAGDPNSATLAAEAPIYECPFEETAGVMLSGDRVFATGRDASGEWIEIRSPASSDARVWIRAAQLTPDADLGSLPVIPCHEPVTVVVETTTTVAETTTTTAAATTTTTVAITTTTTLPAAPGVGQVSATRDPIWEENIPGQNCSLNPNQFTTTQIAAPITAPAGVGSVVMSWSVTTESGQKSMSLSGGQYRATLGPFDEDDTLIATNESEPITVTVTVTDSLGRSASRNLIVTLEDCFFG